ncbi:MAG: L-rhamnose mutarotase [Promicromonosporaceae bacterium]|nr:L-rhamnose mutarotase [Promicromonosporaceae bacterium]
MPDVMRRAEVIELRPERAEEYRALHRAVWPDVLACLTRNNVTNYSIFERDGMLFSYLEYTGDDYARDASRIAADPVTREWWTLTDPCQRPVASARAGETWAPLVEVFHLD